MYTKHVKCGQRDLNLTPDNLHTLYTVLSMSTLQCKLPRDLGVLLSGAHKGRDKTEVLNLSSYHIKCNQGETKSKWPYQLLINQLHNYTAYTRSDLKLRLHF